MSNLATIVNNILADSGIDDINVVVTNGSYSNPAWITALSWSKISSTPTTLSGYGITDAVPANRTITINGTAQDLSVNRSWSVGTVTSVDMTVPTGFAISGRPITSSGTLALTFDTGYSLPSNATQGVWNIAYSRSLTAASVTGTTTKTLTLTQQDGSTLTASWTDYDTAPVTSVNAGTGISVNQTTGAVTVTNTGVLSVNGSTGAVTGIITTSNYNSYSPTLTGGGASGTWGINITGDAGTLDGIDSTGFYRQWTPPGSAVAPATGLNAGDAGWTAFDGYGAAVPNYPAATNQWWVGLWQGGNSGRGIQLAGGYSDNELYYRKGANSWQSWIRILNSSNYTEYAVQTTSQSNWNSYSVIGNVVGMLAWKNYGNGHVIFDASQGTSPSGGGVSQTNATYPWAASYPTLMGWNGTDTYGVRVDSARISDNTSGNSATTSQTNFSALTINSAAVATQSWVNSQGFVTGGPYLPLSGGTVTGATIYTGTLFARKNQTSGDYTTAALWTESYGNTTTGIAFHISGVLGSFLEMRTNGILYWANNVVLHSGNYNSYAPTLTGGGASGTWGINISGNSSTSTSTTYINHIGLGSSTVNINSGASQVLRNENGLGAAVAYAPLLHLAAGDTMWQIQGTYGTSGSGTLYFRQGYNGSWGTWLTMLSSANYTSFEGILRALYDPGALGFNNVAYNSMYYSYIDNWANKPTNASYPYGVVLTFDPGVGTGGRAQMYISHAGGDLIFRGGWNVNDSWQAWNKVLTNNNYNSYSPTLTGGGASGTWSINITGSAGSASSATSATYLNSSNYIDQTGSTGSWNADFQNTPAGTARYGGDVGANQTNGPGGSWWIQQNFRHTNGSNYWGTQVAWGWEDNANKLATRNVTGGTFGAWVYYMNNSNSPYAWNMNQYVRTSDNVEFNQVSIRGALYVSTWGNSSDIYMTDGDEGTRRIHCNSNRVGFLNQSDGWGAWCDDNGNWGMSLNAYMAGNRFDIQGAEGQISFKDSANVWTGTIGFSGNTGTISYPGRNIEITAGYNATITLNNGNTGYDSGKVYIPYGVVDSTKGYVSNGNPWNTSNSAYFPNGITTAGGTNWIYGSTYIGNAPSNGSGAEISNVGRIYVRNGNTSGDWGYAGLFLDNNNAANNYVPWSFEEQYGNHSWGIVARFHIQQAGADRPSIQFTAAGGNDRWSLGYCTSGDWNFRITQNQGYRTDNSTNDGWGTERFKIDTSGNTYAAIGGTLYANGTQVVTNNGGTWSINVTGNAATATSATTSTSSTYSTYLTSNNASVGNGFASWNSYDDTTNNPGNSWWYGMRVSHGDAISYYSFSIGANFFTNEVYYRRIQGGTSQGWIKFLDSGNYNSYSPTLTGGGASGTWGISVTGNSATTNQLNFGGGTVMNNNAWAGTGGYHGYTYSGGNFRFGFSSTSGVVDVYADGNFYATDSSYLVLHTGNSPYAYNMNQYVRTTDGVSFASTNSTTFYNGRYTYWDCGVAYAPGPNANRFEVGRIGIDYNDWNGVGTFEVELQETYYYAGGRKRYVISYGYGGPVIQCSLVELNGIASQGNFRVSLGSEVVVSGDWRYIPVYVEVQYYTQVAVQVRTTRNITSSTVPEVGYAKVFTSPSITGIGGFSVDNTVYPTSGQADISNPIMRATSYLVTPTIYSGGGNVTFGNNIGLDGSNAQIQFNAAASADLYLSCIPGTRTMQIRNGNSGSPNYGACGLYTGYASFYNNVKIYPQSESWAEGLAFIMPTTSTWGGLRWQRQRAGNDGNWYLGYTALDSSDDLVFGANNGGSQVNNIIRMTKAGPVSFVSTITASAFFESSDRRIKDLIQDNYRVNDIESIRPKLYKKNGKIELGYYAQDVQPILSHAVSANEDGFLNLSYREVHTAKIAYLEDSIEEIKAKILYLENQLKTKQ